MNEVKFNTQICTTREQSERLLAMGLNPETADMHWHYTNSRSESLKWRLEPYRLTTRKNFFGKIDRLAILQRKRTDGTPMTGDEVWLMYNNKAVSSRIFRIEVKVDLHLSARIIYLLSGSNIDEFYSEDKLFRTKEELLKSL